MEKLKVNTVMQFKNIKSQKEINPRFVFILKIRKLIHLVLIFL